MSGHKSTAAFLVALHAASGAPDWLMLIPTGTITTQDGRGPYRVTDAARIAATSLPAAGGKLPIDENHATDLAAPEGLPSPARGWIVELQARDDGIWGRVEWTEEGRKLVADHAYRGISPVFLHSKDGEVIRLLRASLTNIPNLRGMPALHQQGGNMDLVQQLRDLLGLPAEADGEGVLAACRNLKAQPAAQAMLAPIAKAAGIAEGADAAAVLGAVTALAATATSAVKPEVVTALQTELRTVTTALNGLQGDRARERATAFVDNAIKDGRVGVKPLRDHYIAMHAADPARVEKEINAFPIVGASGAHVTPPEIKDGKLALNAEQLTVARLLGLDPDAYAKTAAAEVAEQETH